MNIAGLFSGKNRCALYLSSIGIPDTAAYVALFGKKQPKHVAIIPTACNVADPAKIPAYKIACQATFTKIGFTSECIDLVDYQGKKELLAAKLAGFGGIWVMGGNTFYLNYWLRESGLDALLSGLIAHGFVYGGESAGAVVAGKTLHGVELLDDPADAPEVLWNGLSLVDYSILPHKGNAEYAATYDQAYEEMRLFTPVKTLTDDEYIILK